MWETTEEELLWITVARRKGLKLKSLDTFVSYKHACFLSQDVNWWTGVVWITVMFYQLFGLSFWRHPFTASSYAFEMIHAFRLTILHFPTKLHAK